MKNANKLLTLNPLFLAILILFSTSILAKPLPRYVSSTLKMRHSNNSSTLYFVNTSHFSFNLCNKVNILLNLASLNSVNRLSLSSRSFLFTTPFNAVPAIWNAKFNHECYYCVIKILVYYLIVFQSWRHSQNVCTF